MSNIKITKAEAIKLEPGDLLLVTVKGRLSAETAHRIREQLRPQVPAGVRLLVADGNTSIKAYQPSTGEVGRGEGGDQPGPYED